jgi:serine/threonine protein kinase
MLNLVGMTTADGWEIKDPVTFAADHTGGQNSQCHFVERNGVRAFFKALDIEASNPMRALSELLLFQYEGNLVQLCKDQRLSRIVRVLEKGDLDRDSSLPPILRFVPYLVFELADGDIRETVDVSKPASNQWRFHVLHQSTLALMQLHGQDIAHQDVKPSNVLRFEEEGVAPKIKLGDLGRSSQHGIPSPTDGLVCPGALNYAPFEQRYAHLHPDWRKRRISADVFHLGCLTVFAFTNISFPGFVMEHHLAEAYHPKNWGNPYPDVQPHVVAATVSALDAIKADFPDEFRDDLVKIVLDLCHPDPELRGRLNAGMKPVADRFWLQPFVARFDALEKRSRIRKPAAAV